MDFYTQQAINDYLKNQRQQPLYNNSDFGSMSVSNPTWASQPLSSGAGSSISSSGGADAANYTNAAGSLVSIIATAALAAQQDKAERELYRQRSELENKIFSERMESKQKQQELNNRSESNRSAFNASDLGIKTASNQNTINSNTVNNIVNALARAYLNKG